MENEFKMVKIDFKKEFRQFYSGKEGKVQEVNVPSFKYLMIDGKGYPGNSKEYSDAIQTLYPLCYTIKFIMKAKNKDFTIMPLEGLWWSNDMNAFSSLDMSRKDEWKWTSLIMQPDFVTKELIQHAVEEVKRKGKDGPSINKVRFEELAEGLSAQLLHIGPYSEETKNIQKIHEYIREQGGSFDGFTYKHHEIYLSDPRRTKPERLKTIIRQPYRIK